MGVNVDKLIQLWLNMTEILCSAQVDMLKLRGKYKKRVEQWGG